MRRNGHWIVTQRGEKFAIDRSEWTTLGNIALMYDNIYNGMVGAGVAEKLDRSVFFESRWGNC